MDTNKQPRKLTEYTANVAMAVAPALASNGWTAGKNFFKPVAAKQQVKNKSFFFRKS